MRVLVTLLAFLPAVAEAQALTSGAIDLQYLGAKGTQMRFAQVPVVRGSSLQLYAPGWKQGYYSSNSDPTAGEQRDGAVVITRRAKDVKFLATETIKQVGENRVEITLAGKLDETFDAKLEWAIGYVNVFTLLGGSVSAEGSDMLVPILPEPAAEHERMTIVPDSAGVRMTSRIGRITIKVEKGPAKLTILDGRRGHPGWSEDLPTLFLGITEADIKGGDAFEFRVSIEFTPKAAPEPAQTTFVRADVEAIADAYIPQARPIQIIPKPRQLTWQDGAFPINAKTRLFVFDKSAARGAQIMRQEAKDRFGWDWTIAPGIAGNIPADGINFVGRTSNGHAESYEIRVTGKSAEIHSDTAAGFAFGAQTLAQTMHVLPNGASIPALEISDWPSLAFRGVHLFPGRNAVDFYSILASRVLARFKFNHVVLQSDYAECATNQKIWIDKSVPKSQLAQYVEITRYNGMEPIPLVQSLGHCEWMFKNGQNLDLAEDPQTPYAYDVTNPKTYEFMHGVYGEAIDLFKPKFFNIGHDEVDMRGRYPNRETSKKLGRVEMFAQDVKRHDAFLRPRGINTMLWGDMLLARDESNDSAANATSAAEAKQLRDALPRDAVICDWHYTVAAPQDYISLKVFHDAGLRTIASTWFNPQNIYNFAQAARQFGAWGLLQTTWAGYHITEETVQRETKQFSAYILAAEYAWSGDSPKPADLPWRADDVLADALHPQREATAPLSGKRLNLSAAVNTPLNSWLGFDDVDLSAALKADRIGGVAFKADDAAKAVVLSGTLLSKPGDCPKGVTLQGCVTGDGIAFLHCTATRAEAGEEVGAYEIAFADGSLARIPLHYGREIRAWDDVAVTSAAPTGWFGKTKSGLPVGVRVLRWTNSHPEKEIKSITFFTKHPSASPALLGITVLSPP